MSITKLDLSANSTLTLSEWANTTNKIIETVNEAANNGIDNTWLAVMPAHTFKGNISSVSNTAHDVTLSDILDFLNADGIQTVGNANATISASTRTVFLTSVFTATRTLTLPAVDKVQKLLIVDKANAVSNTHNLSLIPTGSDTVNGVSTVSVKGTGSVIQCISDGTSNWVLAEIPSSTKIQSLAPLNSPSLTGIPTAPTANSSSGATQIANKGYVDSKITALGITTIGQTLNQAANTAVLQAETMKVTTIPSSANLNDYTTPGLYAATSVGVGATITNSPSVRAFELEVTGSFNNYIMQRLTQAYTSAGYPTREWVRSCAAGSWGPWRESNFDLVAANTVNYRSRTSNGAYLTVGSIWDSAKFVELTFASPTTSIDMGSGFNFSLTLGGNTSISNPTRAKEGQSGQIRVKQDGVGSRTLSWGTLYDFANGGTAPTISTTADSVSVFSYVVQPDGHVLVSSPMKNVS